MDARLVRISLLAAALAGCVPDATPAAAGGSGGDVSLGGGGTGGSGAPGITSGNGGVAGEVSLDGMGGLPGTANGGTASNTAQGGSESGCDASSCAPAVDLNTGRPPRQLADIAAGDGPGFEITTGITDRTLISLASGQDTNGDGRSDIVLGLTGVTTGAAYMVWGERRSAPISLVSFVGQGHGFTIEGPARGFGDRVALVRDVNDDGRGDIVVTRAPVGIDAASQGPQAAYVIFGNQVGSAVNAANVGDNGRGYVIEDTARAFTQVAGVGDLNADGREDIAVPLLAEAGPSSTVLVAFGQSGGDPVTGFELQGTDQGTEVRGVAGAGDVNGDGRPDIVVAASRTRDAFQYLTYVVFGPAVIGPVSLPDVEDGVGGFAVHEGAFNELTGPIAGVGDVNGDGLDDLLLGAPSAPANDSSGAGRAYVVFGKRDTEPVNLATIENGEGGGFVINGTGVADALGAYVSGIGDQNGDGNPDLLVSAPGADSPLGNVAEAGAAFVVFGKADPTPVESSRLSNGEPGGFAIFGSGTGVGQVAAGDIDGDGTDDIVLGSGGSAFVIFGGR